MIEQGKCPIEYTSSLFEVPFEKIFKKITKGRTMEKGWPCVVIWLMIGGISMIIFTLGLHWLDSSIDLLTTFYFVGGLGWVPAGMCVMSRAYYNMCQTIYPYLDESDENLAKRYEKSANSIFGYLRNSFNVFISIIIWTLMLITVIINNHTFSSEYTSAAKFIYIFYILVGIVFTSVPCAVIRFLWALFKLKKLKLKNYALHCGAGNQLQKIHTNCIVLIWGIFVLLLLLSVAMLRSPYHETLWIWLPFFGFVPLALFIMNHKLTSSLINAALSREDAVIQEQINRILENPPIEQKNILLYALLGIQDKLREHTKRKATLANAVVFISTILGGIGSIAAAIFSVSSNEAILQNIMRFFTGFVYT